MELVGGCDMPSLINSQSSPTAPNLLTMSALRNCWKRNDGYLTIYTLDKLLKNYQRWELMADTYGMEEIRFKNAVVNLHDIPRYINSLPPRQREAVILLCLADMSEEEASTLLGEMRVVGKTRGNAGNNKKYGLTKLVEIITGEADE